LFASLSRGRSGVRHRGPGGEGQYTYPAIKMAFWQDEKSCRFLTLCLRLMLPVASPIASRITCVTGRDIRHKSLKNCRPSAALPRATWLPTSPLELDLDSHAAGEWNAVFGVEPNAEMREAGERLLAAAFPNFTSVAGTAEATALADHSVDFVTAAQAAHWFNRERARREFVRILKPGGWLVLLWNERLTDSTKFLRDYEQLLLTYGTDYEEVRHERTTDAVNEFFAPAPFQESVFEMRQEFDYAGVEGRLLSSSYAPGPEHAQHAPCCASCGASLMRMRSTGGLRSSTRRGCILDGWPEQVAFLPR